MAVHAARPRLFAFAGLPFLDFGADPERRIQFSEEFNGSGAAFFRHVLTMALRASFQNTPWHPIEAAAAKLG
jgi:hypothetical protein